jgi:hypothetical protein
LRIELPASATPALAAALATALQGFAAKPKD